jgi:hypothetical protein
MLFLVVVRLKTDCCHIGVARIVSRGLLAKKYFCYVKTGKEVMALSSRVLQPL